MADTIHEHYNNGGGSMGFVIGAILLIVALFLIVYFMLPAFRGGGTSINMPNTPSVNINPK